VGLGRVKVGGKQLYFLGMPTSGNFGAALRKLYYVNTIRKWHAAVEEGARHHCKAESRDKNNLDNPLRMAL